MFLKKKSFLNIIDKTPLCSIDILINIKNKYVFGLRKNKPASGYYFVPGGRILKNEIYEVTIKRILKNELGLSIINPKFKIIGIYNHIYRDNVFNAKNINTTIGFVRFDDNGEIEYIFVNPIFRKKGWAKKLLKLVKEKTKKDLVFQKPISPLGKKLIQSL